MAIQRTIKIRRDTSSNWTSNNPTPVEGELCLETDSGRLKIGDGITAWTSLLYLESHFEAVNATSYQVSDTPVIDASRNIVNAGSGSFSSTVTALGGNSTNWNTAYTHSQTVTGNPHDLGIDDLADGSNVAKLNQENTFTARLNVSAATANPFTVTRDLASNQNTTIEFKQLLGSGYIGVNASGDFGFNTTADLSTPKFSVTRAGDLKINGISRISSTGAINGTTVNATTSININGANINTASTLTNVAYLNSINAFTAPQNIFYGFASGALNIGADVNATSRTASVRKLGVVTVPNYALTGNIESFSVDALDSSNTYVYFGGRQGGSAFAATELRFTTAPTTGTAGGTTRLVIDKDGNSGFGVTSPTERVDVGGNIKASGTVTATNFIGQAAQTITYSATPTQNWTSGNNATITLTGDVTTYTLSNVPDGGEGKIRVLQNATGGYGIDAVVHTGLVTDYIDGLPPSAANINSVANGVTYLAYQRVGSFLAISYAGF